MEVRGELPEEHGQNKNLREKRDVPDTYAAQEDDTKSVDNSDEPKYVLTISKTKYF